MAGTEDPPDFHEEAYTTEKKPCIDPGDGRAVNFGGIFCNGAVSIARVTPLFFCGLKA